MKNHSISQLPLRRLWQERETTLQSCIPDEQNDVPDQAEKAWLLFGIGRDGASAIGLGRRGRIGRQRQRPLKPTVLCVRTRKDGTAAGGRHKLVGIVHGTTESVYRVEGLSANDLENVEDVRIEAQAIGPGHQAIQIRYRFSLDNARGRGKTLTEEADEAEDACLAGTTTDRG